MTVSTGQWVNVTLMGDFDTGDDVQNVFQFGVQGLGSFTDPEVMDDIKELLEAFLAIIDGITTIAMVWNRFRVRHGTSGLIIGELAFDTPIEGLATGDACPPGISPVLVFPTSLPKVRGRKFLPPTNTDLISPNGYYQTEVINAATDAMAFLLTQFDATNASWKYGVEATTYSVFAYPTTGIFRNIPGYQRRRKQGVGA